MKNVRLLTAALVLLCAPFTHAQIAVTGGYTAQQLAEYLAGPNIVVTNAVLTGNNTAAGEFTGSNVSIGFNSGVVLSTGNVNSSPGPNTVGNSGQNLNASGTAQMTALAGATSYDAVTLEFDFEVQSALIQFNYVFASEEYPEYAPPNNSSYNDVFAFYISGPGITGEENIALVPNSTNPVTINNINPVTNSQYYVDNTGGQDVQFDGYTTVLEAKRNNLTPCETYHLKLVISDAGDAIYNSAVFLQENSLIQGIVDVQTQTVNSDNIALEGCIPASFTFSFDDISNQDRVIDFIIGGTAVNGVDYQFIDNSMTIVAGDTSATIVINAFSDGLPEGQESIWIIYQPAACADYDTAYLFIDDAQPIEFTLDETSLSCFSDNSGEILVNATGGFPPYNFEVTYPNGTVGQTQSNPITGLEAGTYSVQVFDSYGCQADALVIGGVYDADTTFLPDGSGATYDAPLVISGFNPGQTITNVSQIQQICLTMEHSYLGDLQILVESPSGQTIVLKQQNGGSSCDLGEPIATGPIDGSASSTLTDPGSGYEYCFNASPVYGTMVQEAFNFTRNYTDAQGHSYTDTYLPAGSYTSFESFTNLIGSDMNGTWTVHVTDQYFLDNGYIFNWYISLIGDLPDTVVTLTEPEEITVTGFVTNSTCGGNDGAINIDIENAVAPYTVQWSSGQTTEDISGLSAGTYVVTVTDGNGCQSQQTFLVNNIGSLSIAGTTTPTLCYGGTSGAVNITPAGGQAPYTFSWNSGQTTEDISGVSAGTYVVTMTDQQGCVISNSFVVNNAPQILTSVVSVSDEECNTDNGAINIDVTGGTGSYGYQWSNGATTQDLSNLSSGTYSVDIVDGNGCTATSSYTISNNVSNCSAFCYIAVTSNSVSNEVCGNGNGSIDINVLNAVAPFTYSWSNGATTEDLTGLSAGTYTVMVLDANNCSESASFTIGNSTGNLAASNVNIGEENCGGLNGSINLSVTGGAMPYSYLWSNGATTEDLVGIAAGTYTLEVTDGNGCQWTQSYTVPSNSGSLAATATVTNEICTSSNGSINQTVTGGNGTITYAWNTGATTQDLAILSAGTYSCTITDQTGCFIVQQYTVGQTSGSIALAGSNITNELCGNGQGGVNITVTGSSLTYLWSNGATTEDITGVSAGNYSCVITNAQGCSLTTPTYAVINGSGTLNVNAQVITNEICGNGNGSVSISVTGGTAPYTFAWSNGATNQNIFGLSAGLYSVTVTDANGCTENRSFTVQNNSGTLAIQNAVVTHETCGNTAGSIDVILSGGNGPFTYVWSNGATSQDLTALSAGSYTITVTDNNNCSVTHTYVINNQSSGFTVNTSVTNELCSNGQGQIATTVSGGQAPYTYTWSNGATTALNQGLSAGTYWCIVTDNLGCSITASGLVVGNTATGISASTSVTNAICSSLGAVDLTVTGGVAPITFLWSNGATTEDLSNVNAGVYTYTAIDNNGCEVSGSVTVTQTQGTLTQTHTSTSEVCGNAVGAIDLTVTGGTMPYTYLWSNGATTQDLTGLSAGTYSCAISDANGCSIQSSSITISNVSSGLAISNVIPTNETCSNASGSIDISVTGGTAPITYVWSTGATTQDVSNLSSDVYTVVVTDANGCQVTTQQVINSSAGSMAITQPVVTNENCGNGQGSINISLTGASNPITYLWSNSATTQDISNLSSGAYSVTITDNNGCQVVGNYTVSDNGSSLMIANATSTDEHCGSGTGSIAISVTGGTAPYNYVWSNGGTTPSISNLSAGTYTVTVTGSGGCQTQGSYTVGNNNGNLVLTATTVDETCGDNAGAIDLTTSGGNMPLTYQWNNGATTQDVQNLAAGNYNVLVTDQYGCTANYSGAIANNSGGLGITLNTLADENCGQSDGGIDVVVTGSGIVSTIWSSGQTTEDLSGVSAGVYTLTVTDNLGCQVSADYTVTNQTGSLAVSFSSVGNENCMNGQGFVDLETTGTGPFTYLWSDGQTTQDAIGLSAGPISVVITDGNGCQLAQSFTVANINATNLNASPVVTNPFCTTANGEIDITISGGISPYTYQWNTGATSEDLINLTAGNYTITVTDGANCQTTQTVAVVAQSSGLQFTQIAIQPDYCGQHDGSINIFTGGTADDYYLDGAVLGGPFVNNLTAGTYTVAISDNYGCYVDSVITVDQDAFYTITHTAIDETCHGANASIDLTVTGAGNLFYAWSTGATTQDVSGLTAGTYTVTVTGGGGSAGCPMDHIVTITNTSTFEMGATITDEYCGQQDGAIDQTILSGSNLQFLWSNGATTEDLSGLVPGTYSCTITDPAPNGCVETMDYVVAAQSNGTLVSALATMEDCNQQNGAIDLTLSGGSGNVSIDWSNGATTEDLSGLSGGTYDVIVTDLQDGCVITESYTLTNDVPIFGGTGLVTNASCATCTDGAVETTFSQGGLSFLWSTGATTEDLSSLTPGTYTITATTAAGCDTTMTFEVLNVASLGELNLNTGLGVYPNPASENFTVSILLPDGVQANIEITNALGQRILEKVALGSEEWEIDSHEFATGVYLITLRTDDSSLTQRLVINNY